MNKPSLLAAAAAAVLFSSSVALAAQPSSASVLVRTPSPETPAGARIQVGVRVSSDQPPSPRIAVGVNPKFMPPIQNCGPQRIAVGVASEPRCCSSTNAVVASTCEP